MEIKENKLIAPESEQVKELDMEDLEQVFGGRIASNQNGLSGLHIRRIGNNILREDQDPPLVGDRIVRG